MRLISEVPLGAFLSGGIDSSAVVAMMSRVSTEPVKTFCMGFGGNTGGYLDERGYARMVAERYGTDHAEYEVVPNLEELVEKISERSDGHYTVNHMKRFARSGALSPDMAYLGYISKINDNILNSFFSDGNKFRSHLTASKELILDHFRTDNVDGRDDCLTGFFTVT
jgi:hypothetical protein